MNASITGKILTAAALGAAAAVALAKLPPPTPEQRTAADLAKAKTAYAAKKDAYDLCRAMDRVAANYAAQMAASGKPVKPDTSPRCEDPGPFVPPAPPAAKPS